MKILYLPNEYSQQRQREKRRWIYPVHMAMEAEYYRREGHEVVWGGDINDNYDLVFLQPSGLPFLCLPHPDRVFTDAFNKRYQNNGNFKYRPGTYIMSAGGCWHGACTFCVEQGKPYEIRKVTDVIDEIIKCKYMGFREVFDDSATFPVGDWLNSFCNHMCGIHDMRISCNMRLTDCDFDRMRRVGFRMVLFGFESANQKTLDKISKGVKVEDVKYIIKAAKAGLEPHIAVMFGCPGEDDNDALKTLRLVWWLLKKGYAKTAQASLYRVAGEAPNLAHQKFVGRIYDAARSPVFWLNKLMDIHDVNDLKYLWRQIREGIDNLIVRSC